MDNDSLKGLFSELLETVNKEYELREQILKESGYSEEMFELLNEIQEGGYEDVKDVVERYQELTEDMERDEEEREDI